MHSSRYTAIMRCPMVWRQNKASKIFGRNCRPNPVFNSLESLPMELLQIVLDQLDDVSLVCLQNTNSRFRAIIPSIQPKNLSQCQKWMIMCRFETDMQEYPALVACAFCKVKRPQEDFGLIHKHGRRAGRAKTNTYCGIELLNMMNSKPIKRYCYRHLSSCLGWPPAFQKAGQIKWVRTLEPTCLHCGSKPTSCGQSAIKFYGGPATRSCCDRPCDICPTAYLPTFSRHGRIHLPWFTTDKGGFLWCFGLTAEGDRKMVEWRRKKGLHSSRADSWFSDKLFCGLDSYVIEYSKFSLSNEDRDSRPVQVEGRSCVDWPAQANKSGSTGTEAEGTHRA